MTSLRLLRQSVALVTVALSTLAADAQDIVHLDLGNQPLDFNGPGIPIDLDGDGRAESILRSGNACCDLRTGVVLDTEPGAIEFLVGLGFGADAPALEAGEPISGGRSPWNTYAWLNYTCCGWFRSGQWTSPVDGYVGYRIPGPQVRYGWIRISNSDGSLDGFVIHEAAFNSGGNPILAGEGSSVTLPPRLDPVGGVYNDYQTVTLTSPTPGATIYYTLDGSNPGPGGPVIANGGSVQITRSGTSLRCYAVHPTLSESAWASGAYTLIAAAPVFDPSFGPPPVTVAISSATTNAAVYYTLDGSDPVPGSSQQYTGPLQLNADARIRAVATKPGLEPSAVVVSDYRPLRTVYVDPGEISLRADDWTDFDLDFDGTVDLVFYAASSGWLGMNGVTVATQGQFDLTVDALPPGLVISADSRWERSSCGEEPCILPILYNPGTGEGNWSPGVTGILGATFMDADGLPHFAWVRVRALGEEPAAVVDWAYQEAPFAPILAADTGELDCPPRFRFQPAGRSVDQGESLTLVALASGPDLAYQWLRDGVPIGDDDRIGGAATSTLRINDVRPSDTGAYTVRASSSCGSTISDAARVSVVTECAPFAGSALRTDGLSAYAAAPDGPDLDLATTATIEAWFRAAADHAGGRIISKGDGLDAFTDRALDIGYGAGDDPSGHGKLEVEFFLGPAYAERNRIAFESAASLQPGIWHHLAVTLDTGAGQCSLFIDGQPAASTTVLEDGFTPIPHLPIRDSSFPLTLGATDPWSFFRGTIDEVRVWNIVRTPVEIAGAFERTIDPALPGLVAYYRFDEGSGDFAGDLTGRGNTAELRNGARWARTNPCCPADFNDDGGVDGADVEAFFLTWQAGEGRADVNGDGGVDGGDVETFFVAWEAGGCG